MINPEKISQKIAEEFFKDKNLLDIYRKSFTFSETSWDFHVKFFCTWILIIGGLAISGQNDILPQAQKALEAWQTLGASYGASILGFLIAGFTIFASMTKIEVFIALSLTPHPNFGISWLRFIFYSFLRVFIVHITLLSACVFSVLTKDIGLFVGASLSIEDTSGTIRKTWTGVCIVIVGYLLLSSLLHLKTFVWNLYQSILIAISGGVALHENQTMDRQNSS